MSKLCGQVKRCVTKQGWSQGVSAGRFKSKQIQYTIQKPGWGLGGGDWEQGSAGSCWEVLSGHVSSPWRCWEMEFEEIVGGAREDVTQCLSHDKDTSQLKNQLMS